MRRLLRPFSVFVCLSAAALSLPAQTKAPAVAQPAPVPMLLAKFNFEDIPAWVPNWGAANNGSYKPATGWKTPFVVKLDPVDPHSGENSLRFELLENRPPDAKGSGERLVHSPQIEIPPFTGTEPAKLVVRFAARTKGIYEGALGIRVLERNDKQASLGLLGNKDSILEIMETPTWREFEFEAKLRTSTRSIAFMVVMYGRQQAPATVWIDDISLEYLPAE
jgi:hypothetical protein